MKISALQKYSFSEDLMMRKLGETIMMYNPQNGDMYEMNETAAVLIDYLKEGYDGEQILNSICSEYDIDRNTVEEDLDPLVDRFLEIGLLKLEE